MLKEKLSNVLMSIAEESAKVAVNDASSWLMYQEEEPEEVKEKYTKALCKEHTDN